VIVRKYGGTSVGSFAKIQSLAQRTKDDLDNGSAPLVVVLSAMSGETNRLLEMVAQVHADASPKLFDLAAACGEQISVALFSAALEKIGLKPCPLLGFQLGIQTDPFHSRARIRNIDTQKIHQAIARGEIPVIAGYQGMSEDQSITTLGRGGSDTSAVAIAAALGCERCEIYTDVIGMLSADPRVVKNAQLISEIDYESALELAALGSKVLHSRCVELASKYKVHLWVADAHGSDPRIGTLIMNNKNGFLESAVVSGVAVDMNVIRCHVSGSDITEIGIFEKLSEAGINIDVIVYDDHNASMAFTTTKEQLKDCEKVLGLFAGVNLKTDDALAKVSIVGLGMQHQHGVAAEVFSLCKSLGINIKMISTSEIKISVVVASEKAHELANALHKHFLE
jgi:aspartate kinase